MDIIISSYPHWTRMVLSGKKPLEFRKTLPKGIRPGDTIYLYETRGHNGAGAIVGKCKLQSVINVCRDDGKWPVNGSYPFIDYWCEHILKDKYKAEIYRKVKEEFLYKFEHYKHGYIIDFAFCEEELDHIREHGRPINTWEVMDFELVQRILKANEMSRYLQRQCDNWLSLIGFYNEGGESDYKYALVLTDIEHFSTPIQITKFKNKNGDAIQAAPQSWMYTRGKE